MQLHAERLQGFGAAILNAHLPTPEGLVGPDGLPSPRRFAVYRNNVIAGLIDALKAAYPVIHRLVGEDFFRAMAAFYASREPPDSPILLTYGAGFPDFLAAFPPVAHLPYLPDVARIERAWVEAYHAAEAPCLDSAELAAIAPENFGQTRLRLHPSLRVITSRFPALTIWQRNLPGATLSPVDLDAGGQAVMLLRPDAEVMVFSLPEGGAAFLLSLQDGLTVGEAALSGFASTPRFDLQENLTGLLTSRAFVAFARDPQPFSNLKGPLNV